MGARVSPMSIRWTPVQLDALVHRTMTEFFREKLLPKKSCDALESNLGPHRSEPVLRSAVPYIA